MIDAKRIMEISHKIMRREIDKIPTQDLEFIVQNSKDESPVYKKAKDELERRIGYANLKQQEKANFWSKTGVIISLIVSAAALLIATATFFLK